MIYSLRGNIIHVEQGFFVIECGGVGYRCFATMNTLKSLPRTGTEATVFTYMNVREDAVVLFGFNTQEELNCYKLLTSISGVGSKVGLAILSELKPEQVAMAVASGDNKTLTRAAGVGNKLAQRIILELKDKLKGFGSVAYSGASDSTAEITGFDIGNIPKAVAALAVLGYSSADVTPILSRFDSSLPVEQLIRMTLVEMGKR